MFTILLWLVYYLCIESYFSIIFDFMNVVSNIFSKKVSKYNLIVFLDTRLIVTF